MMLVPISKSLQGAFETLSKETGTSSLSKSTNAVFIKFEDSWKGCNEEIH